MILYLVVLISKIDICLEILMFIILEIGFKQNQINDEPSIDTHGYVLSEYFFGNFFIFFKFRSHSREFMLYFLLERRIYLRLG